VVLIYKSIDFRGLYPLFHWTSSRNKVFFELFGFLRNPRPFSSIAPARKLSEFSGRSRGKETLTGVRLNRIFTLEKRVGGDATHIIHSLWAQFIKTGAFLKRKLYNVLYKSSNIMGENEDLKDYTEIKLDVEKEFKRVIGELPKFPKYTTQIINLANQNAQGTRPKVVGQLSELIHKSPEKNFKSWKRWYTENYPDAIDKATAKVSNMIKQMQKAVSEIDDDLIHEWVEDLVITKTAEGLVIQEIILKYLAEKLDKKWKKSTPAEESKFIDGYIGETPVQIKPATYLSKKPTIRDKIDIQMVYYKKTNKYLYIYTKLL